MNVGIKVSRGVNIPDVMIAHGPCNATSARIFSAALQDQGHPHNTSNSMPPRLNIAGLTRTVAFRPRPQVQWHARSTLRLTPSQPRLYSDSTKSPAADRSKREDAKPIEHVSEEAASMAKTMGEEGPDLSQGTPIEDVSPCRANSATRRLTITRWSKATRRHRKICQK